MDTWFHISKRFLSDHVQNLKLESITLKLWNVKLKTTEQELYTTHKMLQALFRYFVVAIIKQCFIFDYLDDILHLCKYFLCS